MEHDVDELVERYSAGQMSRRRFIQRATAAGLSVTAAAAIATAAAPRAGALGWPHHHPDPYPYGDPYGDDPYGDEPHRRLREVIERRRERRRSLIERLLEWARNFLRLGR